MWPGAPHTSSNNYNLFKLILWSFCHFYKFLFLLAYLIKNIFSIFRHITFWLHLFNQCLLESKNILPESSAGELESILRQSRDHLNSIICDCHQTSASSSNNCCRSADNVLRGISDKSSAWGWWFTVLTRSNFGNA